MNGWIHRQIDRKSHRKSCGGQLLFSCGGLLQLQSRVSRPSVPPLCCLSFPDGWMYIQSLTTAYLATEQRQIYFGDSYTQMMSEVHRYNILFNCNLNGMLNRSRTTLYSNLSYLDRSSRCFLPHYLLSQQILEIHFLSLCPNDRNRWYRLCLYWQRYDGNLHIS